MKYFAIRSKIAFWDAEVATLERDYTYEYVNGEDKIEVMLLLRKDGQYNNACCLSTLNKFYALALQ